MDAYADAIVTLLLFLVAAPAILYQITPYDVREVLVRSGNRRYLSLGHFVLLGLALVVGGYLVADFLERRLPWRLQGAYKNHYWAVLLLVLFLLAGYTALRSIWLTDKKRVINLSKKRLLKNHRAEVRFAEKELSDLRLLGQESRGSEERDWVIDALQMLAEYTLRSDAYDGTQLETLINTLLVILLEGNSRSTPENFRNAVHLLRTVISRYKRDDILSQADLSHTIIALKDLAKEAISFPVAGVTKECLDSIEDICSIRSPSVDLILDDNIGTPNPRSSQAIREIGVVALMSGNNAIAMQALTQLQYMSEDALTLLQNPKVSFRDALYEVIFDYIGLLAYFWMNSESGAEVATACLLDFSNTPGINLEDLLKRSIDHHKQVNRYETADYVREMKAGALWGDRITNLN